MAYSRLKQSFMADLDTGYKGSSGQIDDNVEVTPSTPTPQPVIPSLSSFLAQDSALSRSRTILHARAKSLAAYMPKMGPVTGTIQTPNKPATPPSSRHSSNKLFGDIFSGESGPVKIGVEMAFAREDEPERFMEHRSALTERPKSSRGRKTPSNYESTLESPLKAWFTRRTTTQSVREATSPNDELLSLDIQTALFPDGTVDSLSPHAFNGLLLNSTALLGRFKDAYQKKDTLLTDLQSELEAQREETEEVEVRSTHLKIQLEDMCRKAEEQSRTIKVMSEELAAEKRRTRELEKTISGSVRLVTQEPDVRLRNANPRFHTAPRSLRSKRASVSIDDHDSGFESNEDSASVASGDYQGSLSRDETTQPRPDSRDEDDEFGWKSEATLRQENHQLRRQLAEMQSSLQGCIDLVGNLTMYSR